MNKTRTTVLILFTIFFTGLAFSAEKPDIEDLLAKVAGNPMEHALLEAGRNQDYSALYELMHPDWSEAVREETFISILKEEEFSLIKLRFSKSHEHSDFSYHIVHFSSQEEGIKISSEAVLFLKKYEDQWRLMNFPFLLNGLPNFTRTPTISFK